MKIKYAFVPLLLITLAGCKNPKPVASTPAPEPQKETKPVKSTTQVTTIQATPVEEPMIEADGARDVKQNPTDSIMAFIVSFYSIGEGIDRGMPDKLKTFTDAFGKKNNLDLEYVLTHWGREGETDYCFTLKGLSESQVADFKTGVREELKSAEHVHYLENQPCRKGR